MAAAARAQAARAALSAAHLGGGAWQSPSFLLSDAPDVYEENIEEDAGETERDAALLKLPAKRKQKHRGGGEGRDAPPKGGGGGAAASGDAPPAADAAAPMQP